MTSSDPPAQATGQVGQTHILVVDDDGEIRRLVAKFLRENGFHVLLARDGREMLACLATAHIDLIVLMSCCRGRVVSTFAVICAGRLSCQS